ncbi:glycoside hydrolase family 31 protein [Evansella tamaricis]|uniref:Glycoside hydrolase family 31 protein n=1 Tax=Evansella tamaricis TaxID=2069301 RepID=A0ABS6JCR7_9BACI|nr:glycoside hydrolase family 31 protein [Evansella tamaricis]MBU9711462.1 glycoside hydrolase family 31 protein [Evansella tamaricis]
MMHDTSFAIHPGTKKEMAGTNFKDIGNLRQFIQNGMRFNFQCEQGFVSVQFYSEEIVRIIWKQNDWPDFKSSPAVIYQPNNMQVKTDENDDFIKLSTSLLKIQIQKSPFRISVMDEVGDILIEERDKGLGFNSKGELVCYKCIHPDDRIYGLGEKTGFLDKRGESYTMWNTDVYAPHNPETDPLYQTIPFFTTLRNGKAFGVFLDNTGKTFFNMRDKDGTYEIRTETGQFDYYIFAGPTLKKTLTQYTTLTGTMPLPPKWALGFHQSRYSYETEEEVRELAHKFLEKGIPLDAIYLDIHYMNGYRVFTFDEERFPNPRKLIKDLRQQGIRVVPIVDPGVKEDPEYSVYQEGIRGDLFCKYLEGNVYFGDVWPGNSAFPDFTDEKSRRWWADKHKFYSDLGIEGIWNDMNEPAVFNETKTMDVKVIHENEGNPKTHRELHNLYGLLMGKATFEGMKEQLAGNRTFLLTRAGYAGVQRYASVWTGDNRSFWEHLQLAIPMCMNLGMSGVAFCGPDVGGFAHDTNGELLARWTQFGTFTPYFRNHSAIDTARQEPWEFGEEIEQIVKSYIQLRYVWLPELYRWFKEAHDTGVPVMRPLVLEYPEDKNTFNLSDQFMIGENVIIAPIMTPETEHRVVYLPKGQWIDYWTEQRFDGEKHHLIQADLKTLPVFVKEDSAIAQGSVKQSTDENEVNYQVHLFKGNKGETQYTLYEDDGKSYGYEQDELYNNEISFVYSEDTLDITTLKTGLYKPVWDTWSLVVHGKYQPTRIYVDGKDFSSAIELRDGKTILAIPV